MHAVYSGNQSLDSANQAIVLNRTFSRGRLDGPRLGDFIRFSTGQIERISHKLENGNFQTSPDGGFFIWSNGQATFGGGSNPAILASSLVLQNEECPGRFWFFHHDQVAPGNRVDCELPCRVYNTDMPYKGFLTRGICLPW